MNSIRVEQQTGLNIERASDIQFDLYIDERSFLELVTDYELPFAKGLAGAYALYSVPLKHKSILLCLGQESYAYPVMGCDCGFADCWPLYAHITRTAEGIRWDSFEQPHRKQWNYCGLGPFLFDVEEYEREMSKICVD